VSYSIDVIILLYGSDTSSRFHERALAFIESCAGSDEPLFLAYLTLLSYVRIATHPRIFTEPLTPSEALANIGKLATLPQTRLISERDGFLELYEEVTEGVTVRANLVPEARLATLLRQHGVGTLYTNNVGDFARFQFLDVRNPMG
jgi:toxin-antitoxin system PIN domain toxin